MDIRDVKFSLGDNVVYQNESKYKLTACIIRRDEKTGQFYYQAELQDLTNHNSILICRLEDIKEE